MERVEATSFRPRQVPWWMLTTLLLCGLLVLFWFIGEGYLGKLFQQTLWLFHNPPSWVHHPVAHAQEFLLLPTVVLLLCSWGIMLLSPQPRTWSRILVIATLLALSFRYFWWRTIETLNLTSFWAALFSLALYAIEILTIVNGTLNLLLLLFRRERHWEADRAEVAVLEGKFLPTVDILIPTYNEAAFILERTIIGCQALDYPREKVNIYLLDDTRRSEMADLAVALGCHYIARSNNLHAKAGNLNNAIAQTQGELILCFDADFIPTRNFLKRTVGFFQEEKVALVQTPQTFYNPDPLARNLGLENILTAESELFYRLNQPARDRTESVICSGTSFVLRRSALQEIGGEFVTSSLSEDYFTGIKLAGKGYRLIYLNEKLSAGEAPNDMAALATQRLRWAQGTLQAFFIQENPLIISGLSPLQRMAHLSGILHWFGSISRIGFLVIPVLSAFTGVLPLQATQEEVLQFFLPHYLVNLSVFSWLSLHSRSLIISEIYDVLLCFPLALRVVQTMVRPFGRGFKVTPKGEQRDRITFHWQLALPLLIVFTATALSLWRNLGMALMHVSQPIEGLDLPWIWSLYNLFVVSIALLVLFDLPKPDQYEWFALKRTLSVTFPNGVTLWGTIPMLSEAGACFTLTQPLPPLPEKEVFVTLTIREEELTLQGKLLIPANTDALKSLYVEFIEITLAQRRALVSLLFCRPSQWCSQHSPGEILSLWLLLANLVKPRAVFGNREQIRPIAVGQS